MRQTSKPASRKVIWVALLTDGSLAITKFVAASLSGSSAMFAEALHSLADAASQGLFFVGRTLSRQPADAQHPFGYGKERFFWPFIVSVVIFSIGGVFSLLKGLEQIRTPHPLSHLGWNLAVLGAAVVFDGVSWFVARSELRRFASGTPIWSAIRESKTPAVFAVFLQDTAGPAGIALAGSGMLLARWTEIWMLDGIVSVLIGALLFGVALIIASETKSLLIGEQASADVLQRIKKVVDAMPEVKRLTELLTMHLGPDEILVNIDIEFRQGLNTDQIEEVIDRIEQQIRRAVPAAAKIFIEVEGGTVPADRAAAGRGRLVEKKSGLLR